MVERPRGQDGTSASLVTRLGIGVTLLFVLMLFACSEGGNDNDVERSPPGAFRTRSAEDDNIVVAQIPDDLEYVIVEDTNKSPVGAKSWRTVRARINRRISNGEATALAQHLRQRDKKQWDATLVALHLPEWHDPYVTVRFDPQMEVAFWGVTLERERELASMPQDPTRSVIGAWVWDWSTTFGNRATVFRSQGNTFFAQDSQPGEFGAPELIEIQEHERGKRFRLGSDNPGDYYLINEKGALEFWNQFGVHRFTMPKVTNLLESPTSATAPSQPTLTPKVSPTSPLRTWTSTNGYTVEAELKGILSDSVRLEKADGEIVMVPTDKLSPADREFIKTWSDERRGTGRSRKQ